MHTGQHPQSTGPDCAAIRPTPYDRASMDERLATAREIAGLTGMAIFDASALVATVGFDCAREMSVRALMESA